MKNQFITSLLLLSFVSAYSQDFKLDDSKDLRYEVRGAYVRSVTKTDLNAANSMKDVISGYPSDWINSYISTEVSGTVAGKPAKASGKNETLNADQKDLLNKADLGTNVVIDIKYLRKNPVGDQIENNKIHVSLSVVPEVEAEFLGGYQKMKEFLNENAINKISETKGNKLSRVIVKFTVNEQGEVADVIMTVASGDTKIDKLLIETITRMPKWKPAENAKGEKVKQEFLFTAGNSGGC